MYDEKNNPRIWGSKRYFALNYYLRQKFGQKVFKIPLDAGFTCPNRDGNKSYGGCAFCSARGSGDFAGGRDLRLEEQFKYGTDMMHKKWKSEKYIAYFQAFTNTYAPVEKLKKVYEIALNQPGVIGIAIATRPDCLPPEVIKLLEELNKKTYLWVELGLQTIHKKSSSLLNLQYDYSSFLKALGDLQSINVETCAHIILGLPGENYDDMLATGTTVGKLSLQGLKIHLLHLMKGTPLENIYNQGKLRFLGEEEYVGLVVDILEHVSPEIVIHRLTGDSPRDMLIGPRWSLNKWEVLNSIDNELIRRNSWQGKFC